jgi:hypothetical protein
MLADFKAIASDKASAAYRQGGEDHNGRIKELTLQLDMTSKRLLEAEKENAKVCCLVVSPSIDQSGGDHHG